MKTVLTVFIALLLIGAGGAAFFYITVHQPLAEDLARLKAGQPEFDRARNELKKFRDREKQESGWTAPAVEALRKGLAAEIAADKAEVAASGNRVVVNIANDVLFTPLSVTFGKNSQQALANLASLLKEFKDKEIFVGNVTVPAPAQGKGRKRVPAKDARTVAAGRSVELVKFLEKNGVPAESLVAAAYPATAPDRGFKLKAQKTVIVITAPAAASAEAQAAKPEPKQAPVSAPAATAAAPLPQKPIPITTAPPKKVP